MQRWADQTKQLGAVRGWVGDEFRIEGFPAVGVDRGNTAALLLLTILLLTIFSKPGIFKKMKTVKSKVSVNIGSIQVRRCYVDRLIKKVLRKIQNKADFMGILLQQLSKVHMPKTFYGVKVVIINVFFLCVYLYRYASLYFCCAIEEQDNELITLEVIHRFVELLDKYFGSVRHRCVCSPRLISHC